MTPAAIRALASRVETEEPSEELRSAVLTAFGSEAEPGLEPDPLRSVDYAKAFQPEGWHVLHISSDPRGWYCELYRGKGPVTYSNSVTLAQAWTAAALRALAWEMENAG